MADGGWLDRSARRLATPSPGAPPGGLDRVAARLAGSRLTRRQALGAAGALTAVAGLPRHARAQVLPDCPPPGFPQETKKCPYQCPNSNPNWICCREDQVCCTAQPQQEQYCSVGCCEPGQTCCVTERGFYGCCGCPRGFHQCSQDPRSTNCCRQDQVCDVVNFVCRAGDECPSPNVLCGSVCCPTGQACAGGSCCDPAKSCGGVCCGRGEICDNNACKQLVDYKPPPRRRPPKLDKVDSPKLETFDADVAAEMNYSRSTGGGSRAGSAATGYVIARARVTLRRRSSRTVSMRLTRRAKRELARGRSIPAVFTLKLRDPQGRTITETSPVKILPPRRRRRRR